MSGYDEKEALRMALKDGFPASMRAALTSTHAAAECPKCGGVEWDRIEKERGMHPSDLPINRCPCGHSWSPAEQLATPAPSVPLGGQAYDGVHGHPEFGAGAVPLGGGELRRWHDEADRLKKCHDYATSGIERMKFATQLAAHLNTQPLQAQDAAPVGEALPDWRILKMHGGRLALMSPGGDRFYFIDEIDSDTPAAGVQGDAARLAFISNSPSRYVEQHPTNNMWRVYQDMAPPTAVAANWVAMTPDYHATPSAAIDAARAQSTKGA